MNLFDYENYYIYSGIYKALPNLVNSYKDKILTSNTRLQVTREQFAKLKDLAKLSKSEKSAVMSNLVQSMHEEILALFKDLDYLKVSLCKCCFQLEDVFYNELKLKDVNLHFKNMLRVIFVSDVLMDDFIYVSNLKIAINPLC